MTNPSKYRTAQFYPKIKPNDERLHTEDDPRISREKLIRAQLAGMKYRRHRPLYARYECYCKVVWYGKPRSNPGVTMPIELVETTSEYGREAAKYKALQYLYTKFKLRPDQMFIIYKTKIVHRYTK